MRFSLRLNNDVAPDDLVLLARTAEDLGFDQLWVSNDLFLRSAPVLVGALAVRTTTLGLGIAVMNPYSVNVVEVAMAAATLQELSGGRFSLGLGAGSQEFLGWAGLERPAPLGTTRQAVHALRQLLGHEDVDPAGLPGWAATKRPLGMAVGRPVPVYVGAMGPRMLHMAGECADGALPLLYPPEHFAAARRQVEDGIAAAGRSRAAFDLPACFWVSVAQDAAAGRAALANKLAYYGPSISPTLLAAAGLAPGDFLPAARLAQRGEDAAALVDDRMLSLGIAGAAQDVVDRCRGLVALGADHLSFGPPLGPDPVAAVRVLGTDVLPALRAIGAPA
ncbi:LLM class flavin-dependent oxidoreductase [Kineosporia sp. R_H_3]|uniref:LLM class flavin-dependent oxidoreductase n=1 Tax=Kineosporia sp. R_H_3 TaxID=1961848 RepID=UPI000B4B25F5|nr:LLM class flavin-dependent oxidoreductase [Kineosporia sp. R_H_3]